MAATDIVTVAAVKTHLNIGASDTSQDTELAAFVEAATPVIEHVTGPVIVRAVVENHDGGSEALALRRPPVQSITSVTEDGTTVPSSAYYLSEAGVLYRQYGVWAGCGRGKVQVTYQAGVAAAIANVPASIALAAKELIRVNWRPQQGGNYTPFDSPSDELGQVRLGFFVPNRVAEMLVPHAQAGFA